MTRAWQSARVIGEDFPQLGLQQSPLLGECTPATWRLDIMQSLDEGEAEACENQLDKAFAEFFKPAVNDPEHDILVFHGNAIRYLVTKVLGVDTNAWLGMSIGHASITVVQVKPDGAM
jgi:serine/threonine-protein phosphatase PGAM5